VGFYFLCVLIVSILTRSIEPVVIATIGYVVMVGFLWVVHKLPTKPRAPYVRPTPRQANPLPSEAYHYVGMWLGSIVVVGGLAMLSHLICG
jgi:hypothetical protein